MFKETLICIIIVISIFSLEKITQDYTEKKTNLLKNELSSIRNDILDGKSKDELLEKMKKIEDEWKNMYNKMAYYIEHDELEKVETKLTSIVSYIEMEDKTMAISMIDENNFIIEHIKNKNSFNLQNVF